MAIDKVTKKIDHGDASGGGGTIDRAGIDYSCVEEGPTEMRFPVSRPREEFNLIPQSIEAIESGVVVRVEAAQQ